MPYVCVFKDCAKPNHLYASRREWFDHEIQVHRREWHCEACNQTFYTKDTMIEHIRATHGNDYPAAEYPAVADWSEREKTSKQFCMLCPDNVPPTLGHLQKFHRMDITATGSEDIDLSAMSERLMTSTDPPVCPYCPVTYDSLEMRRHLAHHLQQLALFTLPRFTKDSEAESGDGCDDDSRKARQDAESSGPESDDKKGKGSEQDWSSEDGNMSDVGSIASIPELTLSTEDLVDAPSKGKAVVGML